jgi:hypothetical protein
MEILAMLIIWPFLILAFGLVFITFDDLITGGFWFILLALFLILILVLRDRSRSKNTITSEQEMQNLREIVLIISISFLIPIFLKYLFDTFNNSLPVVLGGLVIGFGLAIWGMFIKSNKVLMYSNVIGGALAITYAYFQIWQLGDLARIVASGFGLFAAVMISVIKLKDKLV